MLSSTLY
jgi:hypothetical protein